MAEPSDDPRETPLHPRLQTRLLGHAHAERHLLTAYHQSHLHHAWLFAGPRGIGKATLAYRFARYVLRNPQRDTGSACPPDTMDVSAADPVFSRIASRGHSDLLVLERPFDSKTKRVREETPVEAARKATSFFSKTAGEGGWRVCIVDAADDMTPSAANALLKILEEPPDRALFILVTHAPGKLLPTIRSRTMRLNLAPLASEILAQIGTGFDLEAARIEQLAPFANGSVGRLLEIAGSDGADCFLEFIKTAQATTEHRLKTAEFLSGRNRHDDFRVFCQLLTDWIASNAKHLASCHNSGERPDSQLSARWADAHGHISHSIQQANVLNLDRRQVVLEALQRIHDLSGRP